MNKLVAGKIPMARAMAFWRQTRKGAVHRITVFEHADDRYRSASSPCPKAPGDATFGPAAGPRVRQCMRAASVGDQMVATAEAAIMTWEHHVHEMEMLRAGKLSPTQAARMWSAMWRAGNRQMIRYDQVSHHAALARCR